MQYLRDIKGIESISTYGMSMDSLFAAMAAKYMNTDNRIKSLIIRR